MNGHVLTALMLSLFAGLATGIGGAIAFFAKRTNTKFLSVALGFSAGVMVYISFVEIFSMAKSALIADLGTRTGSWITVVAFFGGMFIIAMIDKLVPEYENPHEMRKVEDIQGKEPPDQTSKQTKLMRTGLLTALAISIHNFPEGFASFMSALRDPGLGVGIAIAIAIHNIPEGISVSMPVYYATGSRRKAFVYSFLSGVTEPVGAVLGYLILSQFMTDAARRPGIRGTPSVHLWIDIRHDRYGDQPAPVLALLFFFCFRSADASIVSVYFGMHHGTVFGSYR